MYHILTVQGLGVAIGALKFPVYRALTYVGCSFALVALGVAWKGHITARMGTEYTGHQIFIKGSTGTYYKIVFVL